MELNFHLASNSVPWEFAIYSKIFLFCSYLDSYDDGRTFASLLIWIKSIYLSHYPSLSVYLSIFHTLHLLYSTVFQLILFLPLIAGIWSLMHDFMFSDLYFDL